MMTDPFDLFFSVFTATAVLYAASAGLAFGATVLLWLVLRRPPRIIATTWQHAVGASVVFLGAGSLFFIGQGIEAFLNSDPFLPRIIGRLCLWTIFSVAVGSGLGFSRSFAQWRRPTPEEVEEDVKALLNAKDIK